MKRQIVDLKNKALPRVAILLIEDCWASSVVLARELLLAAGTLNANSTDLASHAMFRVSLAGHGRSPVRTFGGMPLRPECTLEEVEPDVVILPAQFAPTAATSPREERLCEWLRLKYERGATLLGLAGALLLAKTGLLDRREATGLVSERAIFRSRFPQVRFLPARRIVASGRLITVCGIGPTPEAVAHLIEQFHGAAAARRFLRHTSTEGLPVTEQTALWSARFKRHRDVPVLAAQEILERDLHAAPALGHLAAQVGLSERSLQRRLAAATGLSLRHYLAELRLARAEHLLANSELALIHVAQDCGFASAAAFSRAFSKRHGAAPGAWRRARRS
jgi:transcriptional regulator GlxA family with amidase domain